MRAEGIQVSRPFFGLATAEFPADKVDCFAIATGDARRIQGLLKAAELNMAPATASDARGASASGYVTVPDGKDGVKVMFRQPVQVPYDDILRLNFRYDVIGASDPLLHKLGELGVEAEVTVGHSRQRKLTGVLQVPDDLRSSPEIIVRKTGVVVGKFNVLNVAEIDVNPPSGGHAREILSADTDSECISIWKNSGGITSGRKLAVDERHTQLIPASGGEGLGLADIRSVTVRCGGDADNVCRVFEALNGFEGDVAVGLKGGRMIEGRLSTPPKTENPHGTLILSKKK
ncbi:MAG: hypothetical protein ABIH11_08580 [Candidatus Altiarchaeota archaeon]